MGAVLGVAGHKADAEISRYVIHHPQQPCKAARLIQPLAVRIYILPQQGDIPAAVLHQIFYLARDIRGQAAALAPAHEGHNAVGTKIIAAVHHRHKGLEPAFVQHRHLLVQGGIGAALPCIPADAAPPFDKDTVQKLRQPAGGIAAHYKIHIGITHFQLFAYLLLFGHAARQGDHQVRLLFF